MTSQRKIYPLDGRGLTEEQIAVAFAMVSRSPEPVSEIADRVSVEAAGEFNDRWVTGYGHASVAEHAVVHLAVENISRIAADWLEDGRLASYTERSTRYQTMDPDSYHTPQEVKDAGLGEMFTSTMRLVFSAYRELLEGVTARLERENAGRRAAIIRRAAHDACRGLLPAATLTTVGMTANARELERIVTKLVSSPLTETRDTGSEILEQAKAIAPTLIRRAGHNQPLAERQAKKTSAGRTGSPKHPGVSLTATEQDLPGHLATIIGLSAPEHRGRSNMEAVRETLEGIGPRDPLPREFESVSFTLAAILDYGALRQFRRHRMMSHYPRPVTTRLGYAVPREATATGMEEKFREAAEAAGELYELTLGECGQHAAQYAVLHAHLQQTHATLNLRELWAFLRLRLRENAHDAIRETARGMLEAFREGNPGLAEIMERAQPVVPEGG